MSFSTLKPDWPAPAHARAACSLREGGVSAAPYDSLNLGDHVGDNAQAVAHNRHLFADALQAKPVFLKQVHGAQVIQLSPDSADGMVADACWTTQPGVACTIMVADCLPVLFAHRRLPLVGAAHAGWRGLCGQSEQSEQSGKGVLEAIFDHFCHIPGTKYSVSATNLIANDFLVWLGPCIGPQAFEVGAEVREAFVAAHAQAAQHFKEIPGDSASPVKFLANLPALARQRLHALGITHIYGNDGSDEWCTVRNPSRFFSHRRDRISGRFAAAVWLV
jgi:polyphenol oxidase